jgi:pimeloyl-ACP methyl ester carboxylesterase
MVPTMIVAMDAFPFTPSGKVDVRALALPEESAARSTQIVAPRTDTERELADIWKRVLRVNDVGVHDSFFDLGGDSLRAVDLFLEIEQQFDQDLPLALLAESPTIEALAKTIDRGGTHEMSSFRSLRVIQRGDDAVTPLFLVHGGGGNVIIFRQLARNLPRHQPVYAFEWDGWSRYRGRTTIPAMARLYADELTALYPKGAIRLGGHCIGGLIAIEMARNLRKTGREIVDPLIITDTPNLAASTHRPRVPTSGVDLEKLNALRTELSTRLAETAEGPPTPLIRSRRSLAYDRVVRLARRVHQRFSKKQFPRMRFENRLDAWLVRLRLSLALPISPSLRSAYCSSKMIGAARRFRSQGYDGAVLYFRTRVVLGTEMGLPGWWTDLNLGFEELCPGRCAIHFVNADHNGVVGHPKTAEVLRTEGLVGERSV